jgi:hypothetical protein
MQEKVANAYLRSVRSSLHVRKDQQRRALEEIENHLDDAAAAHMRSGATRARAIALAIDELGPAEAVAAAFNDEATPAPDGTGALRWLPMLLPVLLFTLALGLAGWSLTWLSGGLTTGEQAAQRMYLRSALIAATLAYASYRFIRRAEGDAAWRWAAWLCTGFALLTLAMR